MMSVLILPHTWFRRKWHWLTFGIGKAFLKIQKSNTQSFILKL